MKRYDLKKVQQKGKEFYVLVADPRIIVKLLVNYEAGAEQDTQRPWEEKRVKEISRYVSGKFKDDENKAAIGLIPNAPILNVKNKIDLQEDAQGMFILLPESKAELKTYEGTIEAIDGQHRIRAFMEEYIDVDFASNTTYEMIFSVFFQLSTREKKEIFMITNEKQVKVPGNLLRMYKRELDLLKGDEVVYDLVCLLNSEDYSPLKNRVMIGSRKIKKGYQESQISKILNRSESYRQLDALTKGDHNKMAKMISNYLIAWEQVYGVSYQDPGKDTLTKISGLRYVLYLFPVMLDILGQRKKSANSATKRIIACYAGCKLMDDDYIELSKLLTAFFRTGSPRKKFDDSYREQLIKQQNGQCAICHRKIIAKDSHLDHIVPWDYVGDNLDDNYQMLCETCNERKGTATYFEFSMLLLNKEET